MKSESIGKLAEALSKAQGAMNGAVKGNENPFFKSRYADLAAVWEACRAPLATNGLAVVQTVDDAVDNGRVVVETVLMHSSGEWISGRIALKPVKDDPQAVGSAITYARRYGLQSIVGIAPEDDDGNAASGTGSSSASSQKARVKIDNPKPKEETKAVTGIAEGQRSNFKATFTKALRKDKQPEADTLMNAWLQKQGVNFDTMDPNDFFGVRDEAERHARTL